MAGFGGDFMGFVFRLSFVSIAAMHYENFDWILEELVQDFSSMLNINETN